MSKKINVLPVILCGGSGSRLWPLSRTSFPKQFLVLSGTTSLFQQAISRFSGIGNSDIQIKNPLIVTNEEHRFIVLEQLRELKEIYAQLILEPEAKNTAPALTLAALQAICEGQDPVLVVTPADQIIKNEDAFNKSIQKAIQAAELGSINVLGIAPDRPETGFGYIMREGKKGGYGEYKVKQFVEKPDLVIAKKFFENPNFTWNSGIFVLKASVWLDALKFFRPDIYSATQLSFEKLSKDGQFIRPEKKLFNQIPGESIDYAVMESCPNSKFQINVVELNAGWNDLGSWHAVWKDSQKDGLNNSVSGDVIIENMNNSYINASHRLVCASDISNLIIVETADAILVANRETSQSVKKIFSRLQSYKREERVSHRKVFRPWGWFDLIDEGEKFKVKKIGVNPGASLSLQRHSKRAEHWVVIKGTAEILNNNQVLTLNENQSTYIPIGVKHRLSNPGSIPLEIIEVQSGSYLGEDDIERFEDIYGRK
ncbi:mannose-1-phosphate guanylyltransferase/mannose-6-phosphate isomerase [Candidatus Methylopumilus planktonicus]|uniref:mannose-1-phosphate guanylyltransferase/mannose-6-phosphate isomerase n=1 Tax=Candidatus Methylopumilus planktonicus TaxID=1581557 RepID=UPI003BEF27B7